MNRNTLACALVFVFGASPAFSESLKEKKEISSANETIKEKIAEVNKACDAKINASVNYKSFKFDDSYSYGSAANYCGTVLDGIRYVCESGAEEKAAVKKGVKKLTCGFVAKMETNEFAKKGMKITGGNMTANYHWTTGNIADGSKEFLMNAL